MSNTEPSYDDLFNLGKAEAASKRPDLSYRRGDISEMTIAAAAAMGTHVATYAADRYKATTTEGENQDLQDLAEDHWQINRVQATSSIGTVTLSRPSAGGGEPSGTLAAGFVVATLQDSNGVSIQFALDNAVAFGLSDLGPHDMTVTASVPGPTGDVGAGAIRSFPSSPFDPTITVTNAQPTAGGDPDESDDSLRADIRNFPNAIRKATNDALAYWTGEVPGVANVTVVEEFIDGLYTGIVNIYVSDINGASNDALINAVKAQLPNYKASGAIVNVLGGAVISQTIVVSITLVAGLPADAAAALVANVRAAILAGVNATETGATLLRDEIRRWGVNVDPDRIKSLTVTTPPGDVSPAAYQIIRDQLSDITVS